MEAANEEGNALTIASARCLAGPGIERISKAFFALGIRMAHSVITALVAQIPVWRTVGVPDRAGLCRAQLDSVFSDVRIDTTKSGMLAETDIVSRPWRATTASSCT